MNRFSGDLRALRGDDRGVAAIEAAFVVSLLGVALMNVVEVSRYAYVSTQVAAVTQAAAQAAVIACDPTQTPVTVNCPKAATAIATAIHGSSLGEDVSLIPSDALTEAWYCVTASGALQKVAGATSSPGTCNEAPAGNTEPGLYLQVRTTYTYQPIFPGLTVAKAFSETIDKTAWMRTL